ncbi:MAG: hypothetical protein LBQ09_02740 [Acidobacteriaceae bacterium]|jgi:hypothetical protein|nr:hypothetical protein [Acidobacteriaceae bacterium]
MSLKNFHLLFIALSVVMALFAAGWALLDARETSSLVAMGGAVIAIAGAVALVWYEKQFLRRAREMGL